MRHYDHDHQFRRCHRALPIVAKRVRADVSYADLNEAFEGRHIDMNLIQADSQARCSHKCREVLNAPVDTVDTE